MGRRKGRGPGGQKTRLYSYNDQCELVTLNTGRIGCFLTSLKIAVIIGQFYEDMTTVRIKDTVYKCCLGGWLYMSFRCRQRVNIQPTVWSPSDKGSTGIAYEYTVQNDRNLTVYSECRRGHNQTRAGIHTQWNTCNGIKQHIFISSVIKRMTRTKEATKMGGMCKESIFCQLLHNTYCNCDKNAERNNVFRRDHIRISPTDGLILAGIRRGSSTTATESRRNGISAAETRAFCPKSC